MFDVIRASLDVIAHAMSVLGPYWGWFATVAILSLTGETLKRKVFTPELAQTSKLAQWWLRTMPLHPVATGALLGCIPGMPMPPGIEGFAEAVLYYASAGVCSVWAYDAARTFEKYAGIEPPAGSEDL